MNNKRSYDVLNELKTRITNTGWKGTILQVLPSLETNKVTIFGDYVTNRVCPLGVSYLVLGYRSQEKVR